MVTLNSFSTESENRTRDQGSKKLGNLTKKIKLMRNPITLFKNLKDYQTQKDMFLFCINLKGRNGADAYKLFKRGFDPG